MVNLELKYYIRIKNGSNHDYYYVDNSGNVTFTTSATPVNALRYSPEGWNDQYLSWERIWKYFGLKRSYSLGALSFVEDGAKILRSFYYTGGIQTDAELFIEIFDSQTYTYLTYYNGAITFNGQSDHIDSFNCEVAEGGFQQNLEAYEAANFDIPVSGHPDKIWVKMHTCYLSFRQRWLNSDGETYVVFPLLTPLAGEGPNFYLDIYQQDTLSVVDWLTNKSSASRDVTLTCAFSHYVTLNVTSAAGGPFQFHLYYSLCDITSPYTESAQYTIYLETNPAHYIASGGSDSFIGSNTQTITIPAGKKLIVKSKMRTTTGPAGFLNESEFTTTVGNGDYIDMVTDQETPQGYFEALRWRSVQDWLLKKINNGTSVNISSGLLGSTHLNKVLTCGDAIRNLPSAFLKTNYSDDFTALNTNFGASFYYDPATNTAHIEPKSEVFQNTLLLDVGEVANAVFEPFSQEMCSRISIGQSDYTYDTVNGKDEFNTEFLYKFPINTIPTEKDYKSPYRKDPWGVISTFVNLNGKTVTDSDTDNDVFIIHIGNSVAGTIPAGYPGAGSDYYDIYINPSWAVGNMYRGDVIFNTELSPVTTFLNNGDYFHSLLYGLDSKYIEFTSSKKSNSTGTKMYYTGPYGTTQEGADILVGDLADPLFKPVRAKIKLKVPVDMFSIMESNPYGYIQFIWLGYTFKGFIIQGSQDPTQRKQQEFDLLITTDTDLTNLIR